MLAFFVGCVCVCERLHVFFSFGLALLVSVCGLGVGACLSECAWGCVSSKVSVCVYGCVGVCAFCCSAVSVFSLRSFYLYSIGVCACEDGLLRCGACVYTKVGIHERAVVMASMKG